MRFGRAWVFTCCLSLSLLGFACGSEERPKPGNDAGGPDSALPLGPLGRIQGRVQLTDGTGLGGIGVTAQGVGTRTDELGIFVLDAPVGPNVTLAVDSDYYTRAHLTLEVIENSSVSAALEVVPLKRLALEDVDKAIEDALHAGT